MNNSGIAVFKDGAKGELRSVDGEKNPFRIIIGMIPGRCRYRGKTEKAGEQTARCLVVNKPHPID
jgi:hypothetical protein